MLTRKIVRHLSRLSRVNTYTDRTHNCGELGLSNEGENVTVMGWLAYKRMNRFLVLRDAYGTVQATIPPTSQLSHMIKELPYESVVQVNGTIRNRGSDINPNMKTGAIEIDVSDLSVLNRAETKLPLEPDGSAAEKTRLRYRYLDIRGQRMQRSLRLRSDLVHGMRRFLVEDRGFVDVETPTLFRRTPGGAAEFLVPAAAPNKGSFYSLPQSPQQFKQLLMVGGIDRYFQIARCYRDEGSKGDRQPEFTQVDLEVSFTNQEGIMRLVEEMLLSAWPQHLEDLKPSGPFPRITFNDAMRLYGSDKPDMRIPWTIEDCTTELSTSLRPQFASNDWSAGLIVCRGVSDAVASRSLKKEWRRLIEMNSLGKPFAVHTMDKELSLKGIDFSAVVAKYDITDKDAVVVSWGKSDGVQWTLGQLRNMVAEAGALRKQRQITCHWVVDFPLFSMEDGRLASTHHPFTAPIEEHRDWVDDPKRRLQVTGQHYDLVVNGVEMGGGSIRIHNAEQQRQVLRILNEDTSEMNHLLEALSLGAPPHGGFALGLDRFTALMAADGDPAMPVREVIAFPKTKEGRDLMSGAPVQATEEQLQRYGIAVRE